MYCFSGTTKTKAKISLAQVSTCYSSLSDWHSTWFLTAWQVASRPQVHKISALSSGNLTVRVKLNAGCPWSSLTWLTSMAYFLNGFKLQHFFFRDFASNMFRSPAKIWWLILVGASVNISCFLKTGQFETKCSRCHILQVFVRLFYHWQQSALLLGKVSGFSYLNYGLCGRRENFSVPCYKVLWLLARPFMEP